MFYVYETVERHIKEVEEAVCLCFMFMFDVSSKSTDNKAKKITSKQYQKTIYDLIMKRCLIRSKIVPILEK
jgi:hypothetical protein